jgi:hypothetical protein
LPPAFIDLHRPWRRDLRQSGVTGTAGLRRLQRQPRSSVLQRANLVVVEGGACQLFSSHWCANTLPRDLFGGPEHALAFIRRRRAADESMRLDDARAEDGALLDIDRKPFLLSGGEDVRCDVPPAPQLSGTARRGSTVSWGHDRSQRPRRVANEGYLGTGDDKDWCKRRCKQQAGP